MALTPSSMVSLGTPAAPFQLRDTDGNLVRLQDFADSPALVVAFICNHCPYVRHIRDDLARVARELMDRGAAFVAICSNDAETHPEDGPEAMAREKAEAGYPFPYLHDETQEVARAYGATCTPDFFVFDRERRLAYRGQFDGSRPGNDVPVTGEDLKRAVLALLEGRPVPENQQPSIGCNIKWKPGREPSA